MSENLLQRILQLLDLIESPVIPHFEAASFPADELKRLRAEGILRTPTKSDRIRRPARYGPGPDVDVIESPGRRIVGVTVDDDFHYDPISLTVEDTLLYPISLHDLVSAIRKDNDITARGFRDDGGLISVGSKSLGSAGVFAVYLSLPNASEQALLARCARLRPSGSRQDVLMLVPSGVALSPEARTALGGIRVLSLWDAAGRDTLELDWAAVVPDLGTRAKGKASGRAGEDEKRIYSDRDEAVYKLVGEQDFNDLTNEEIGNRYRFQFRKVWGTRKDPTADSVRACLNRIRRHHKLSRSEAIRKKAVSG